MIVLYSFAQNRRSPDRRPIEIDRTPITFTPAMTVAAGIVAMTLTSLAFLAG